MSMAIITGASSGLGREYVRAVYRRHPEIDELVLIARRRERLEELGKEMDGRKVTVLALDVTRRESRAEIADFLKTNIDAKRWLKKLGFCFDNPKPANLKISENFEY